MSNLCVRALWDFQGENDGDLAFVAGQAIIVVAQQDNDWWTGYVSDDPERIGIFPCSYVQENQEDQDEGEKNTSSSSPSSSTSMSSRRSGSGRIISISIPEAERKLVPAREGASIRQVEEGLIPGVELRTMYTIEVVVVDRSNGGGGDTTGSPSEDSTTTSTVIIHPTSIIVRAEVRYSDIYRFAATVEALASTSNYNINDDKSHPLSSFSALCDFTNKKRTAKTIEARRIAAETYLNDAWTRSGQSADLLPEVVEGETSNKENKNQDKRFPSLLMDFLEGEIKQASEARVSLTTAVATAAAAAGFTSSSQNNTSSDEIGMKEDTGDDDDNDTENDTNNMDGIGEILPVPPAAEVEEETDPAVFSHGKLVPFSMNDLDSFDSLLEQGYAVILEENQGIAQSSTSPSASGNSSKCSNLGRRITASWIALVWDGAQDTAVEAYKMKNACFTIGDYRCGAFVPPGLHMALASLVELGGLTSASSSSSSSSLTTTTTTVAAASSLLEITVVVAPHLAYDTVGRLPAVPANSHMVYRLSVFNIEGDTRKSMKRYQTQSILRDAGLVDEAAEREKREEEEEARKEKTGNGASNGSRGLIIKPTKGTTPVDNELLRKGAAAAGISLASGLLSSFSSSSATTTAAHQKKGMAQNTFLTAPSSSSASATTTATPKARPSPEEAEQAFRAYLASVGQDLPADYQPGGAHYKQKPVSASSMNKSGGGGGIGIFRRAFGSGSSHTTTTISSTTAGAGVGAAPSPSPAISSAKAKSIGAAAIPSTSSSSSSAAVVVPDTNVEDHQQSPSASSIKDLPAAIDSNSGTSSNSSSGGADVSTDVSPAAGVPFTAAAAGGGLGGNSNSIFSRLFQK